MTSSLAWSPVISFSLPLLLAFVGDSWKMLLIVCTVACTPKAEIFIDLHLLPPCPARFRDTCSCNPLPADQSTSSCLVLVFWPREKNPTGGVAKSARWIFFDLGASSPLCPLLNRVLPASEFEAGLEPRLSRNPSLAIRNSLIRLDSGTFFPPRPPRLLSDPTFSARRRYRYRYQGTIRLV